MTGVASITIITGVGVTTGVGPGVTTGVGPGVTTGVGLGVTTGVGLGVTTGVGLGVTTGVGLGVTTGVGLGVTTGVGVGVTTGVGLGVTTGVGLGVAVGTVPSAAVTEKRPSMLNRAGAVAVTTASEFSQTIYKCPGSSLPLIAAPPTVTLTNSPLMISTLAVPSVTVMLAPSYIRITEPSANAYCF